MTPSQELQNSIDVYRQTHIAHPEYFTGYSLTTYVSEINALIQHSNIKTCLDYGCGKAHAWSYHNLSVLFGLDKVVLYDPGVERYSMRPADSCDLVLCIDVLEHVPEGCVDEVLLDICSLAKKAVFLNITTRPATKKLVDGTNAHATVKPKHWWQAKIEKMNYKLIIAHYIT